MSDLKQRVLYQDVSTDASIGGLKPHIAIIYLVIVCTLGPIITIIFAGSKYQFIGYLMLLVLYLLFLIDVREVRKTNKMLKKDRKNQMPEYFSAMKDIDVVTKDVNGNEVAFTTNSVKPWELATASQKEEAAKDWAMKMTELVCHKKAEVSIFAYTHKEFDSHLERKYMRSLEDENQNTRKFSQTRVSLHSVLRNASMATTYVNRVTKMERTAEEQKNDINELVALLPGVRLGKSSILKMAEHLSPNGLKRRGGQKFDRAKHKNRKK